MARSNNVLNTGFCPRAKRDSIELFTEALTFSSHNAKDAMLGATKSSKGRMGKTVKYAPPSMLSFLGNAFLIRVTF